MCIDFLIFIMRVVFSYPLNWYHLHESLYHQQNKEGIKLLGRPHKKDSMKCIHTITNLQFIVTIIVFHNFIQ